MALKSWPFLDIPHGLALGRQLDQIGQAGIVQPIALGVAQFAAKGQQRADERRSLARVRLWPVRAFSYSCAI
jgi:hypothetical protein